MPTNFNTYRTAKKGEQNLYTTWKDTPSDENLNAVFKSLKPTINSALTSFGGGDPNLSTRAYILTREALDTYDPKQGANIKTHVFNHLRRLSRFKAERSTVVHVPEQTRLEAIKIHRFKNEFQDQHRREPSIQEIAENTGISKKRIKNAGVWGNEANESLFTSEKGDVLGGVSSVEDEKQSAWVDYVYFDLDPVNKKIMEWTTGYGGAPVLKKQEIAKRLEISPAAVSGRVTTILNKLQEGQI